MRGDEPQTAPVILAMIHGLPAHSRLVVKRNDQTDREEKPDLPEELEDALSEAVRLAEARRWKREDQELMALTVNALHRLIEILPPWDKDKRPDLGVVGPDWWRTDEENAKLKAKQRERTRRDRPKKTEDPADLMDQAMGVFGFTSGGK